MATTAINMSNLISAQEAHDIIYTSAQTLINDPSLSHSLPAIMLRGGAGVGKSTIVKSIADELGIGFVDVRLAQMERVDICGLPSVKDGATIWNVPSFWPTDPDSKGIIFFDELTAAAADVQVAAYSIILDRRIPNSDYTLPDGWFIVGAGNRAKDRAVAKTMSSALANRFVHFELDPDAMEWTEWAIKNSVHPSVTGFIRYRPANIFKMEGQNLEQGWPSPRSWEKVSNMIPIYGSNEDVLRKVVYGLIGNSVGVEFMEFHRINKKFDDVLEMMTNPKAKITIPTKADEKYAMASAVNYLLWSGKSDEDHATRVDGMFRILNEMSPDFAVMVGKAAMAGAKSVKPIDAVRFISKSKLYPEFAKKFGKAMNKKYTTSL